MEPAYKIAQRLHERRAAKGLATYGRHLDAESQGCMLVHALEESADKTNYLIAEIQRRKLAIQSLQSLIAGGDLPDYEEATVATIRDVIDLLGGRAALAQYDEILGGGTVAENATVDPRDEANPQLREYRFDRYVNGKLKAEGAALVAANDREAAEKLTKLCCDHPVILIGFAVQPTTDPRDEALRVATEALVYMRHEVIGMANRSEGDEWLAFVAKRSVDVVENALAAIRAAGGGR